MEDKKKFKIAIGFFGLPRASDITYTSIHENIIASARKLGDVDIYYHFNKQERVINPRNNEDNALSSENYTPFTKFTGFLESPETITDQYNFEAIKSYGDFCNNDFVSLKYFIWQLHSLKQLTTLFEQEEYDLYLYLRPDLLYHQNFSEILEEAKNYANQKLIWIPDWQWASGYNDRFAIATKSSYKNYGNRMNKIEDYFNKTKLPLHPETLLKFTLDQAHVKVKMLPIRASRVRVGGYIQEEKFKQASFYRRNLWAFKSFKKRVKARLGLKVKF